jgi:Rrf2 family protein
VTGVLGGRSVAAAAYPTALVGFRTVFFTTKAEYGVRLLIELGRQPQDQPVSLKAIADAEGLPLAYLERIVALLKRADLVESKRGAHGGYQLARASDDIAMDEVVLALEGSLAPMECFVDDRNGCATKLLWTRVQVGVLKTLATTTLAELVDFQTRQRPAQGEHPLTPTPA